MRRFCLKISAVDGMDSSGKYAAVIKLMSTGTSKGNESAAGLVPRRLSFDLKMCAQRKAGRRQRARRLADLVFKMAARVMALALP